MYLNNRIYLKYKFINSLFFGLSIGMLYTMYSPIPPSYHSFMGIITALGVIVMTKYYNKIMNFQYFYYICIFLEILTFIALSGFMILGFNLSAALWYFVITNITFIFGTYHMRTETIIIKKTILFSMLDKLKQYGYLMGLFISYIFYQTLDYIGYTDKFDQVANIHYLLILVQAYIIYLVLNMKKSFK